MIVEKSEWKVPIENSEEHKKLWDDIIAQQRRDRGRWFYTTSRFFSYVKEDIEYWMYVDEYDSEERYQQWYAAIEEMTETEAFKRFIEKWMALCVKDSMVTTSWTEFEDLRVD
ncbi:MAG: hypothetical protein ACW98F_12430 [Candidatus Hodarchaeales archaeon]|jgi:hypothetical protein